MCNRLIVLCLVSFVAQAIFLPRGILGASTQPAKPIAEVEQYILALAPVEQGATPELLRKLAQLLDVANRHGLSRPELIQQIVRAHSRTDHLPPAFFLGRLLGL